MTRDPHPFLLVAALGIAAGAGVWWLRQRQQVAAGQESPGESIVTKIGTALGFWSPPEKYAGMVSAAESRYSLPDGMLARLLWQESRYREDIINGSTRSPVGAMGIAQFMPATAKEFGIDPLNPAQAIDAAGKYLSRLYGRFGNWSEALAAYNWGQGNVARKGLAKAPAETRNYFASILSDLGLS
ncbi:MAG: hypothetical protein RugAbin2_02408 [Rugosibacter sp.]|nr:hypothetical protein [Rugosibacter sp.]